MAEPLSVSCPNLDAPIVAIGAKCDGAGSAGVECAEVTQTPAPTTTRILSGREGLAELESAWREISPELGPIEQFDWVQAAGQCTSARRLATLAVFRGSRLVAALPAALKRVHGVPRAVMLGVDEHFEPMDAAWLDERAAECLAEMVARSGRPWILGRLPADSPFVHALQRAVRGRALVIERAQASSPFILLDDSWHEPEQHLNAGRRSDFRRMRRRADGMGKVTTEVIAPRLEDLDRLLDEAFAVEANSWKGRERTAIGCDPFRATHTRAYARAACRSGTLRLCFLRIDGKAAAMQVAIETNAGFWLLKIGYDADFGHCAPGQLLLRDVIADAARAGLRRFEFLGASEPWIEDWTREARRCTALRIYPANARGMAALAADAAAEGTRRLRRMATGAGRRLLGAAKSAATQVVKRAGRAYIAGDTLTDAMRVRRRFAGRGCSTTVGFWDSERNSQRDVADEYLAALTALAQCDPADYLSVKLPALKFKEKLIREVADKALEVQRRVHFDSHGPEVADRKRAILAALRERKPELDVGFTLPGRWRRSTEDADWVCREQLFVRVVKGQWSDPAQPERDLRAGFLEVIDRLAGRARSVAVATHDPWLAEEAIRRLQAAGTPCELELLYGLPMNACRQLARNLGVKLRVYVPYGEGYAPYALSQILHKPRILWWVLKDSLHIGS